MNNSTAKQLDINHIIHPFVQYPRFHEQGSTIMNHAEGCYVYDEQGKRYLDGIAGLWCVNIGYGREEMAQVVYEQTKALPYYNTFVNMSNVPAARLAEKIIAHAPDNLSHVFFTTGGSMSNETAVRIAHYYFIRQGQPSKKKIISRVNSYHGSTHLTAALTGITHNHENFNIMSYDADPLIHYLSCPNVYRKPDQLSEADYCDELITEFQQTIDKIGADNIAAFIAEPIMGAGGVIVAPEGYLKKMWDVCQQNHILFIADEVVTAFGRLGHMFASEALYGVKPDIISVAKGISSGYIPLGATIVSKTIHQVMSDENTQNHSFSHGFTYSCHPVACAAGLKNIEIIEQENLCQQAGEIGDYLEDKLKAQLSDKSIVGNVRGKRLMLCIEFVNDKANKTSFAPSVEIGERVADHCQTKGLIARNVGDFIILSPPLVLSQSQADEIVSTLADAIDTTTAELKSEGLI